MRKIAHFLVIHMVRYSYWLMTESESMVNNCKELLTTQKQMLPQLKLLGERNVPLSFQEGYTPAIILRPHCKV